MKILIVQDSPVWAIGQLSQVIKEKNDHLNIEIISIPPKELRNDPEGNMQRFEEFVQRFDPDVIHFQYWDTANTLSKSKVCEGRKLMLTHHNQKNLLSHDWHNFDMLIVHTKKAKKTLVDAGYWNVEVIQHGIDIEKFQYNENYESDNRIIGYVGRIVPWKGLYDILKAAQALETEVLMMGRIDKPDYWQKCQEFEEQMDINFNTPDDLQTEMYHRMGVYVGNSCDNIEEGTLGFLEAMSCGIPVVTTPSGEAADLIEDGVNGILVEYENYESLKAGLERFFSLSAEEKNAMRDKAWHTVRNLNREVMARKYEKIYYALAYKNDLVSVIIPTCKRADTITKVLDAYKLQTYQPIELVVVIDEKVDTGNIEEQDTAIALGCWKADNPEIPLKIRATEYDGYGLAMARNIGIFEATGNYIIFNDDRFVPERDVVDVFVGKIKPIKEPVAVWGDKGAGKRDFIENFFIIRKKDIANAGMFNERINEYGGQSQEVRERFINLGYRLIYEPAAKAIASFGTHSRSKKRYQLLRMKTRLWKLKN